MFQWSITLTDKQVLMLAAFSVAEPDQNGSQFQAVNGMVGNAWDVRSARKLEEMGLIEIVAYVDKLTGLKTNKWTITKKGRLIAEAMRCDTLNLQKIKLRNGWEARGLINEANRKKPVTVKG